MRFPRVDRVAPHLHPAAPGVKAQKLVGLRMRFETNVAAGGSHTCARRSTGRLYCWGYDQWGQVGDGEPLANRAAPTEVEGHTTTWTQVDVGNSHSCARINARRISCWGNDGAGLLGNGEPDQNQAAPVEIEA